MRSMAGIVEKFVAKQIKLSIEGIGSALVKSVRNWGAQQQSTHTDGVLNAAFDNSKEQSKARRPVGR